MPVSTPIVCFDLGGTLIDDPFESVLMVLEVGDDLPKVAKNFVPHEFITALVSHWRACNRRIHFPFACHFLQEEIWIIAALRDSGIGYDSIIPSSLAPRILAVYREKALVHISEQPQLPSIRQFFEQLSSRGVRVIVASNDREFATPSMLVAAQLRDVVDQVYTSEALAHEFPGAEKPNHSFFHAFLKKEGVLRSQYGNVIYVGDSERDDIDPAKRLGLRTVRYINPLNIKDAVWLDATETSTAEISVGSHKGMIDAIWGLMRQSS